MKCFFNLPFYGIMMLCVMMTGCQEYKPNGPDSTDGIAVNLKACIGQISTLKVANDQWEAGDKIGLYMKKAGQSLVATNAIYLKANNVDMSVSQTGNLSAASDIYYPEEGNVDFVAYYPYTGISSLGAGYSLPAMNLANQTEGLPKDVLYSNNANNVTATLSVVELGFRYALSKVTITVTGGANTTLTASDFAGMSMRIEGMYTQGTLQLADGSINNLKYKQSVDFLRTTTTNTSSTFEALVFPVREAGNHVTFIFTAGGNSWSFEEPCDFANESWYRYEVNLKEEASGLKSAAIALKSTSPRMVTAESFSAKAPIYDIHATELEDFGFMEEEYPEPPEEQPVTITNVGTVAVTLNQPTANRFTVGTLSASTLAAGAQATFTVRPKPGLGRANYTEIIAITGSNDVSTSVTATFQVLLENEVRAISFASDYYYTWYGKYTDLGIITTPPNANVSVIRWTARPAYQGYVTTVFNQQNGTACARIREPVGAILAFKNEMEITATLPNGDYAKVTLRPKFIMMHGTSITSLGSFFNGGADIRRPRTTPAIYVCAYYSTNETQWQLPNDVYNNPYQTKISTDEYTISSPDPDLVVSKHEDGVTYVLTPSGVEKSVTLTISIGEEMPDFTQIVTLY